PSRGSVGASGDLAPLAHLALVLIGEGEVLPDRGPEGPARHAARPVQGREALERAGLTPITLGPKEGLALINGTQPSTAVLALGFVRRTVEIEANSATDNPMLFADTGDVVSGGNFHGAPIAIAADLAAAAIVPLATISERRTSRLVDPALSGLPAFLTEHGG